MKEEKPKRAACDGAINVNRIEGDQICLSVIHDGEHRGVVMSEWNARRMLGALSLILELPLSKTAAKSIEM